MWPKRTLWASVLIPPLVVLSATPAFADDPQPLPDIVIGYENETEIFRAKATPLLVMACPRKKRSVTAWTPWRVGWYIKQR